MNMKVLLLFAAFSVVMLTCFSAGCVEQPASQADVLDAAISSLNGTLAATADEARSAAKVYAAAPTPENGSQALAILYQRTTLTHDLLIADEHSIVRAVYPNNIQSALGEDLSSYPPNKDIFTGTDVYVSEYMVLENGMEAYLLSVPIHISGEYAGYISLSFDPYRLFGAEEQKVLEQGYNLWVMQTDGIQVFDADVSEAGVNLLTDPAYASVREMAQLVAANPSGTTKYVYMADVGLDMVEKTAVWDTFTFGGREWRVVLTKSVPVES
ncbi:hypothetical protein SDC9_25417 [bioreactor metagenome]|uniref:Dret-0059-like sensor domain-containing protein n=1 Tax=bioreactor metagenome TaxID=1076179 RepID=A0A644ULD7_9ZZZZ|nr:hypothetical protein [Methanocorpusculum sp.]